MSRRRSKNLSERASFTSTLRASARAASMFRKSFRLPRRYFYPCDTTSPVILCSWRSELAKTDTLSYIAALEFCEAAANKPLRLNTAVNQRSRDSAELLDALAWHHSQDVEAGHGSIFEESLLALNGTIDELDAAKWFTSVHEFKHYLDNLNYEILRTYGVEGASLPRVRPSYQDYRE
jgi:hypothetical protein